MRSDLCVVHTVCCWTPCEYRNLIGLGLFVVAAIFSMEEEMLYVNEMFSWINNNNNNNNNNN